MPVPQLTFVAKPQNKVIGGLVPLEDIPAEYKEQAEEVYKALKTHEGNMHVQFANVADLNEYILFMKSYCEQRPEGIIYFRRSPTRNKEETEMNFRITDVPRRNAKTNQEINDAVDKVKAAAKK